RPIAELRAGIWRIRERWEAAAGEDATALLGDHAAGFSESDEPSVQAPRRIDGPALIAASWFAPTGVPFDRSTGIRRLTHRHQSVGWLIPSGEHWTGPHDQGSALEIEDVLLTALDQLLIADCADFLAAPHGGVPEGSLVLGDPTHVISLGATVEPGVVFDVRQGAVVVDQGAEVRSGTRLEGPIYVGPGTRILGGFIRGSVFGPECRVRGEISTSVFLG